MGPNPVTGVLMRRLGHCLTRERLCEDAGRRRPSTSQGDGHQKKLALPLSSSWTPGLQNREQYISAVKSLGPPTSGPWTNTSCQISGGIKEHNICNALESS